MGYLLGWTEVGVETIKTGKRSKEIRCDVRGQVKKLGQNQKEIKLKMSYCNLFFKILVVNLSPYTRSALFPMKDYIFLSFVPITVVPYTLNSSSQYVV